MTKDHAKRGLFVLHEGIGSTIFNSQVLEHVKGMQIKGVFFDILCYDTLEKTWASSKKNQEIIKDIYPNVRTTLRKGLNIYYPLSTLYNSYILIKFLLKNKSQYSFIHARADYSTFLCLLTKPFHKLPVYWDCRGDSVCELEDSLSRKNFWVRFFGKILLVTRERLIVSFNTRYAYGALFVSSKLKELYSKKLRTSKSFVIPCLVSEEKFFFDKAIRSAMRLKNGIEVTQKVYLYSGSMIAYQSISAQLNMYKKILSDNNNIVLILTPESKAAKEYFRELANDNLRILTASFGEMNLYYNMADFAFLLREDKRLNWVASPTKFGEYCLTGLPVIMNDTVEQASDVAKKINNYVSHLNLSALPFADGQRVTVAESAKRFYSRTFLINRYVELYNL